MSKYEKPQKLSREAKAVEMSFQEVYKLATDRKIGWIKAELDALSVFKKQ